MFDIITVGSATVDVFAYTESSEIIKIKEKNVEHDFIAYPSGDKIIVDDLNFRIGGGGTNTAVSFSRLGLNTAYLGKLGSDANAETILELLKKENIKFIGARGEKTGYSIVLDSFEHDRTILTFKGTNNELLESDVVLSNLQAKWLYASSMIGKSFDTLKSIMFILKKTGAKIAFNPSTYQARKGLEELGEILKLVDVLILNKEEAQELLNDEDQDMDSLVRKLAKLGPEHVVITDGSNGVAGYCNGNVCNLNTTQAEVVETTGAGDAFASAFVAGLFYGLKFEDSLKLGMVQAENSIKAIGAKDNLLFKQDAFEKLKTFTGEISQLTEKKDEIIENKFVAPEGSEFVLHDKSSIGDLHSLGHKLKDMPDHIFEHHTNDQNHFASWIKDVFSNHELAEKIKFVKSKNEMGDIILKHIKRD